MVDTTKQMKYYRASNIGSRIVGRKRPLVNPAGNQSAESHAIRYKFWLGRQFCARNAVKSV